MTKQELDQAIKEGKVVVVDMGTSNKTFSDKINGSESQNALSDFIGILQILRKPKQPLAVVPDFVPQTFVDQIQVYELGGVRRLYVYINDTWRYVVLT